MSHEAAGAAASLEPIRYCPHCQGEGGLVYDGGPGVYDERYGYWTPTELKVPCNACGGTGELELDEPPQEQDGSLEVEDELDRLDLPF